MKQMIETKRTYARPQMRVVELRQQCHILTGSEPQGKSASMNVTYEEEDI